MARINGRYELPAISPMEWDFDGGGGGGGLNDLYATLGNRVADLPGFGTMWGSFAELGEMQYEGMLAETRAIPEAADALPLAADATPRVDGTAAHEAAHNPLASPSSLVPQLPDLSAYGIPELTQPLAALTSVLPLETTGATTRYNTSPPPPPHPSTANDEVAARLGIDRTPAARQRVSARGTVQSPPRLTTPLVLTALQIGPQTYTVIITVPEGQAEMSRWSLTYRVVDDILRHNGVRATPAEVEETVARVTANGQQQLDFTSRVDQDGNLRLNLGDGTWQAAGQHRTAEGREVRGYNLQMHPQFQQQVVNAHATLPSELRGQRGLVEMRMTERMTTAAGMAWDRYLTPEVRQAFGNITPEQFGLAVAAGGAAGIVARSAARGALGPLGAGAAMYDLTRRYQSAQAFIDMVGAARSQADLDRAARQLAQMTGEMARDGVLAAVGGAAARVAPSVTRQVDEVLGSGVRGAQETFQRSTAEAVTPEGARLTVRGQGEALTTNVSEARARQATSGIERRNLEAHETAGGHTVEQHVGRSENWLRQRLTREPRLDSASSFRNIEVANRSQGRFANRYRAEIEAWIRSERDIFTTDFDMDEPVGIVLERGRSSAFETSRVRVVIERDNSPHGWHFLTSFPIR